MVTAWILEITRGHITAEVGDRRITILGEAHLGSTGYLIRAGSIDWDAPIDAAPLDVVQKEEILNAVLRELDRMGQPYTVEGTPS